MEIFIVLIVLMFILSKTEVKLEKREFNNGECPFCNVKLEYYETNNQGSRGYICRQCDHTVWISCDKIDEAFKESR